MNTQTTICTDEQVLADLEEVCRLGESGIVRDPDLLRRVYERSSQAQQDVIHRHGTQDIGVAIIREMRDSR